MMRKTLKMIQSRPRNLDPVCEESIEISTPELETSNPSTGTTTPTSIQVPKNLAIDATREFTRIGRLVNHAAKNANVKLHNPVKIDGVKRVALVALRDIKENEELFFNYDIR